MYIYIYICGLGAKYYTPEVANVKFRWKVPLKVHWDFPANSTGKATTLWKIPLSRETPSENATGNPLGRATENPRWLLRCRFLVCNRLSPKDSSSDSEDERKTESIDDKMKRITNDKEQQYEGKMKRIANDKRQDEESHKCHEESKQTTITTIVLITRK